MTTPYWQTIPFSPAPCLPCCSTPSGCMCALLIPPFGSPYVDYATAAAVVVDPLQVASCIAYSNDTFANSLTASFDGTTLAVSATFPSATASFGDVWVSIAAKSGATLSLAFTDATNGAMRIYGCDGTEIEFLGPSASPVVSSAIPADGEYFIAIALSSPPMTSTFSACSFALTSSNTYRVNPVIALWDDSGTTRKLWACPKMLLPPLTESTGTWYASCADAAADIAAFAIDCIGYISCSPTTASRTATGGSSLAISGNATDAGPSFAPTVSGFGGFNALGGDTISLAYAISSDDSIGTDYTVTVYDDTGASVYSNSVSGGANISGTLTFTAPYSGRYSVQFFAEGSGNATTLTGSLNVTSSGTMSSNTIQARYDLGIDCAGTLNCGDACP